MQRHTNRSHGHNYVDSAPVDHHCNRASQIAGAVRVDLRWIHEGNGEEGEPLVIKSVSGRAIGVQADGRKESLD